MVDIRGLLDSNAVHGIDDVQEKSNDMLSELRNKLRSTPAPKFSRIKESR